MHAHLKLRLGRLHAELQSYPQKWHACTLLPQWSMGVSAENGRDMPTSSSAWGQLAGRLLG
eukprot:scaffold205764_cov16-Tisochrysis_lutea.AAC.1